MTTGGTIDEVLPDALDGERLDRVVAMLDGCSRATAALLIGDGHVRVDDRIVTQRSQRVAAGSRVVFDRTVGETAVPGPDPTVAFTIVHVDDDVIVVDKPAGLVVHPGAGRPDHTLVNGLLARFPELAGVGEPRRPGIVHRLDGETSGLLVVARSDRAYASLVAALAGRHVSRIYAALVSGVVADERGIIDAPIGRSTQRRNRMAVLADGREARTHYLVRSRAPEEPPITFLECRLETGRTHQIRVHLAAIGHPVLGDSTYATGSARGAFHRVALHAQRLGFVHPTTGEGLEFESPLPEDFVELLALRGLQR